MVELPTFFTVSADLSSNTLKSLSGLLEKMTLATQMFGRTMLEGRTWRRMEETLNKHYGSGSLFQGFKGAEREVKKTGL